MGVGTKEGPSEAELRREKYVDGAGNLRLGGLFQLEESDMALASAIDDLEARQSNINKAVADRMQTFERHLGKLERGEKPAPIQKSRSQKTTGKVGE